MSKFFAHLVLHVLFVVLALAPVRAAVDPIALESLTIEICNANREGFPKPDTVADADFLKYQFDRKAECDKKLEAANGLVPRIKWLIESSTSIVLLLTGFAVALFGLLILLKQKSAELRGAKTKLENADTAIVRASDPIYSAATEFAHEAVNMVLVGEGGSGKTTLIKAFAASDNSFPTVATKTFATYSMVKDIGERKNGNFTRRVSRIYVDDYVGQNFLQVVVNPELEKRRKYVKKVAMVVVVDLFYPDRTLPFSMEDFDKARISEQINFYMNEGILQALASIAGEGDKIILFINKLDMLKEINKAAIKSAEKAYLPLLKRFKDLKGRNVVAIVGSASKGWGVFGDANGNFNEASLYEVVTSSGGAISEATLREAMKENAIHEGGSAERSH